MAGNAARQSLRVGKFAAIRADADKIGVAEGIARVRGLLRALRWNPEQQYKDIIETGKTEHINKFPHQLAYNVIPQIDKMTPNDYTKEEMKMFNETRKITHSDVRTSATCVRVSSFPFSPESVWFETEKPLAVEDIRKALEAAPGVTVKDDAQNYV